MRHLAVVCLADLIVCASLFGCVSSSDGVSPGGGTGGSLGTGGSAAGGRVASGGSGTGGSGTGGSATGGRAATGGSATGGSVTGGTSGTGGATSGSGGATSGSGGAAVGGGTQPPPVDCATPLASRVTIISIPVTPKIVVRGSGINSLSAPIILSTSPSGRAKVAWTDGTNVHITPLDEAGQRAAADVTVAGSEVHGLVAHDDGAAVLVRRADVMAFVRVNEAGAVQSSLNVIGGTDHTVEGSRWIDDWPHQGRLAWSGTQYAAYFGQTGNHGSAGNHQGDQYAFISSAGVRASGGWDWGCSHSLDERLAHNGTVFAPICTSDTYPGAGIFFANKTAISPEPSITNVGGGSMLGGLVPAPDGFWMTFTSAEGRASNDIVFIHISNTGAPTGRVYLTDTAAVKEGYSHLAAYGTDRLLAGWDTGGTSAVTLSVTSKAGAMMEGPALTTARVGAQDDFATYANGDVGWAGAWDDLAQLRVVRVALCK